MRIYLDTNILLSEGWPEISVKLREMLTLARGSQISVVLPEAVEREAKAHWIRDLRNKLRRLAGTECALGAMTNKIGLDAPPTTEEFFDLDSVRDKYIEVVDKLKSEWRIISAPLNPVPLDDLFEMAIKQQAPFEERGKGFQDAAILLSAIDDLMHFPGASGILLSDDAIFCNEETQNLIASKFVDLKVSKSVADFLVTLKSNLAEYMREEWDEDERIAVAELYRQRDHIERFVRETLNREPNLLAPYVGWKDVVVGRVELQQITAAFVPQPLPHETRTGGQSVQIAAAIRCLIRLQVDPRPGLSLPAESLVIPIEIETDATRSERSYTISAYLRAKPIYEPDL